MSVEESKLGLEQTEVFFQEMDLVICRMYADTGRPSIRGRNCRFSDFVDLDNYSKLPERYKIMGEGDILASLQIPELIILYRRFKKMPVPPSPKPFFEELSRLADHQFRQVGVRKDDFERARDFFKKLSSLTLKDVPALWLGARVIDCVTKGFRMNDKYDLVKYLNAPLPDYMKGTVIISVALATAAEGYVHPETIKIWGDLLVEETHQRAKGGLELPSNIAKFARE